MGNGSGKENATKFPTYRGKSLIRCGDVIYYGSMKGKYVVELEVKSKKCALNMDVTGKIGIQLMYTNPDTCARKQIVKSSEKEGLCPTMDIVDAQLQRVLPE